jgi:hypothetical protein
LQVINWEQFMCIPRSAGLSQEAKDLTLSLCTSHDRRLGRNGVDEIKNQVSCFNFSCEEGRKTLLGSATVVHSEL